MVRPVISRSIITSCKSSTESGRKFIKNFFLSYIRHASFHGLSFRFFFVDRFGLLFLLFFFLGNSEVFTGFTYSFPPFLRNFREVKSIHVKIHILGFRITLDFTALERQLDFYIQFLFNVFGFFNVFFKFLVVFIIILINVLKWNETFRRVDKLMLCLT